MRQAYQSWMGLTMPDWFVDVIRLVQQAVMPEAR